MRTRRAAADQETLAEAPASPRADIDAQAAEHVRFVRELFERHRRPLLKYLSRLLGAHADAEDVLQEAYARLLNAGGLERVPERARAYLYRTATNLAYDRFRRRDWRTAGDSDEALADGRTPERIVDFEQALAALRGALHELKPRCRQVFLLRAGEDLSYEAIADRLGVSKRTVEREMRHALEFCQKRLKRAWK